MSGSSDTVPAPPLRDERRFALVVATQTYRDASLRQLRAPARDVHQLTEVLADPDIGDFTVTSVIDSSAHELLLAIEEFLIDRRTGDLLLIYLSCHGLVDPRRRLFFAASDTRKDRLAATGVEAQWLLDQLDDCRARRQVVILDCCFSGAFANLAKGDADLGLAERFNAAGRGRVVLTASRGSEYSFEGEPVPGSTMPGSIFTSALVDGIRSGAADVDRDGLISVDDAYAYAFDRLQSDEAHQTPQRWLYGAEGDIFLARSPAGVSITPAALPEGIRSGLESPYVHIRLGAIATLGEWLAGDDPARGLAARQTLRLVADSDVPRVAAAARALLREVPAPSGPPEPEVDGTGATHHATRTAFSRTSRLIIFVIIAALVIVGTLTAVALLDGDPPQPTITPEPSSTATTPDPPTTPSPTRTTDTRLLVDDFQTRKYGWEGTRGRYKDDSYRIDLEPYTSTTSIPRKAKGVYPTAPSDLRIEVDARSLDPLDESSSFGVTCHLNDRTKDRYLFTIGEGGAGTVRITKFLDGEAKLLTDESVPSLDSTAVNQMRAECTDVEASGQPAVRLVFRLNGRVVARTTDRDRPLRDGTVGIRAFSRQSGIRIEFDNFVVTPL